jgi:hypothetical protein
MGVAPSALLDEDPDVLSTLVAYALWAQAEAKK